MVSDFAKFSHFLGCSLLVSLFGACDSAPAGALQSGGTGGSLGGVGAGGSAASGGAGTVVGGTGSAAVDGGDGFVLDWQDDFTTLSSSSWHAQTFSWDGNLAQFTPNNVTVSNGVLSINLSSNSASTTKPYNGVELRSAKTLTYGKVSARMRFASGSGVVSGLVLFYTPYPNCDWNEIDIEHLGNSSNSSQLNAQVFTGTVVTPCSTSVSPTQDPLVADLGFNAETDFHLYDIEWTPAGVKYYADGALLRTWTSESALLKEPLTILLTIWASDAAGWAGAIDSSTAPTSADIDWIKVYNWQH